MGYNVKQMKDSLNKYISEFKDIESSIKLDETLFGNSSVNNFINFNTSPRGLMMSGNLAQLLVLDKPESKIIQSGAEDELLHSLIAVQIKHNSEVIKVIKRYGEELIENGVRDVTEYVIIFKELESDEIDIVTIPVFNKLHPYFGFRYTIEVDLINSLTAGDFLAEGTILAYPNSYLKEFDEYAFGTNMNVALMSVDNTAEDGIIMSKSASQKLSFKLYENRELSVGSESFPLNLYGDDDNYKPFPEIGEYINDTGAVAASRTYNVEHAPGLMSVKDLQRINPQFDNVSYTKGPGGKVVDIKVYHSNKKKKLLPYLTDTLLNKYSDAYYRYNKNIVDTYDELNKAYKLISDQNLVVSSEFTNLVVTAKNYVESCKPYSKLKKMFRKTSLDLYRAEFSIEYSIEGTTIAGKSSDLHGGKGVNVEIWEDEDMPVDADGVRADIILDPASTVSRLNIGRLYERFIAASSRKAKSIITTEVTTIVGHAPEKSDIMSLSDKDVKHIKDTYILPFMKMFETPQYDTYQKGSIKAIKELIYEIISREFYIFFKLDNDKRAYEVTLDLLDSIFAPTYGKVTYNDDGPITTETNIMIAPMHIILLNKIADGLLAASSSKLNHFGLPIGVTNVDKYKTPWRNNPVRFLGETEVRLYGSYGSREMLAELLDRGASVTTHAHVYKEILNADTPTNIKDIVNRKDIPYSDIKSLELLETLFNSVGLEIVYTKDKKKFLRKKKPVKQTVVDLDNSDVLKDSINKSEEED